jgi:protein gp37
MQWKKPQRIFVNSMSDIFHKDVPDDFIIQGFEVMAKKAPHHIYQILTKRPSRLVNTSLLQRILERIGEWPAHIWMGVSVESQDYTWRIDKLRLVPAFTRFLSCEPLLGPLVLDLRGISWLITGAESGHGARVMDENWVRLLRDQCVPAGVKFFYKQNVVKGRKVSLPELDGKVWQEFPTIGVNHGP